jgi:hypothetical protein
VWWTDDTCLFLSFYETCKEIREVVIREEAEK